MLSFLWLVLLSVEMFTRWDVTDTTSRSLMTVFVLTNTTTILVLPFLLLFEFRVWLDAARIFLLLVAQIGSAAAFTYWDPQIQCPNQTPDDVAVCNLIDVYTMMACWIIPVILILYSGYFCVVVYQQARVPVVVEASGVTTERRPSVLPLMDPEMAERRPSLGSTSLEPTLTLKPSMPGLPAQNRASQSTLPTSWRQIGLPLPSRQPDPHLATRQDCQLLGWSLPTTPQRHMSLPATKYAGGTGPRRAITITNPKPSVPSSRPPNLQVGVGGYPASRSAVRHMSLTPAKIPSYEKGSAPVEDPKRRSAGRLSKPVPAYFM